MSHYRIFHAIFNVNHVFCLHKKGNSDELDSHGVGLNEGVYQIDNGFLTLDIKMLKPIVAARDRSEIIEDLATLIPERGAWPRIERGATHA